MPVILAIDQSTSASKAFLFGTDGSQLDRESMEHAQLYPQPGWVEHDATEIWNNTCQVIQRLLARNQARLREIAFLSITNQRETTLVFDRKTGEPLHRAMVWQCRRGADLCRAQAQAGREERIHELTGLKLDAYFSASKLQWLVRERPDIKAKLEDGSAVVGTIDSYLVHRFTRGKVFACDSTNASRTLLFDIRKLRWDEQLCDWWQVPLRSLPEVRESTAEFGSTDLGGLLPAPIPIRGVMGDSQAALFAQRCFAPGSGKVTLGTGSSLLLNIGATPRFSKQGVVTALAWVHEGRPTYAFEGIIISSAATLSWLKDQLGLFSNFKEFDALTAGMIDSGGVYIVPAFSGLGLPHWLPDARAAIVGLSSHSERRQVLRAALESMAYQVRDALDSMKAEAGVKLGVLQADGGPSVDRILMQFMSDVTGAPIEVSSAKDCSPLGAVFAGMLGAGFFKSFDELSRLSIPAIAYTPKMSASEVTRLHDGWKKAVRQVAAG